MPKNGFDIRQFILNDSFYAIEEYTKIALESYSKENMNFQKKTEDYIDSLQIENDEEFLNELHQKIIDSRKVLFFYRLFYSIVIVIYSSVEINLFKICNYVKETNNYIFDVNDINGNGISKCRKYFEKVCGVDFTFIESEWKDINILNKIRNGIIHNNGKISENDISHLRSYISTKTKLLLLEEDNKIAISEEYIHYITNQSRITLEKLYLELQNKKII